MPSSPARSPRRLPKPQMPNPPRRTQSYTPRSVPARPPPVRRHTTSTQRPATSPRRPPPPVPSPNGRRGTHSTPARGKQHVLIPVPIRAKDAESPVYVRAPSGQRIDFVFPVPKKRGILGRLLDSVEWGEPGENKPFRYRKPTQSNPSGGKGKPFYKRLMS